MGGLQVSSLFLLLLIKWSESFGTDQCNNVTFINGIANTTQSCEIVNCRQIVVRYSLNHTQLKQKTLGEIRMEVELIDTGNSILEECPLLLTLTQGNQFFGWTIPQKHNITIYQPDNSPLKIEHNFTAVAKTICFDPSHDKETFDIIVSASTCNSKAINFTLRVNHNLIFSEIPLSNETIQSNEDELEGMTNVTNTSVSPIAPVYFKFQFPSEVETVLLKVLSEDRICMTLSIQKPVFPVFDDESNIKFAGYWQTFTKKAGITIQKRYFPDGFFLVLVTNMLDDRCEQTGPFGEKYRDDKSLLSTRKIREKRLTLSLHKVLNTNQYLWPIMFPFVIYSILLTGTVIIFCLFQRFGNRSEDNPLNSVQSISSNEEEGQTQESDTAFFLPMSDEVNSNPDDHLIEIESKRYLWLLVIIAIFYSETVSQLIFNNLQILYTTGNQDICYFNNLCSRPFHRIIDFNHVYSNVGYLFFGLAFILLTCLRHREHGPKKFTCRHANDQHKYQGTYHVHYGLFYALGFALMMEGILSGGYHFCPNRINFQFDTSFMYAMILISYAKLYQFRHGFFISELSGFFTFAIVVACVVIQLISSSLLVAILFSMSHILLIGIFQFYLVAISQKKPRSLKQIAKRICFCQSDEDTSMQGHPNLSLFRWTFVCNIFLVIISWTIFYCSNLATRVLNILGVNLVSYLTYYFFMKVFHGEFKGALKLGPAAQPLIYTTLSLVFWVPAIFCFFNPSSEWELSPSNSRIRNEDCVFMEFFDKHDLWHLLSAPALFFSFMVFLTLDDGLLATSCVHMF